MRAADPNVFRRAICGGLLLLLACAVGLCWAVLNLDWPVAVTLPRWVEWLRPLAAVVTFFAAVLLGLFGGILVSAPADVRRSLRFARFAERAGLGHTRFGVAPPALGVFFAEKLPGVKEAARRRPPVAAASPTPLYRTQQVLWRGPDALRPQLQLGLASFSGGKNDSRGPRNAFRYAALQLPRALPHLIIDARGNGSLRSLLPGTQQLTLEGDFDRYFTTYVPTGYSRDALELLTPDVMACLIDGGRSWDLEVIDDLLVIASTQLRGRSDAAETAALLHFADVVGAELGHQAATYSDPRAARPRAQVAAHGRRLRRRSGAWTAAAFAAAIGAMLAFPHVLGWLLDR